MRWQLAPLLVVASIASVGCGTGASSPQPAGPRPSPIARQVCAREAQTDIADTLGEKARYVSTPVWSNHVYSCQYRYPQGTIALSVKELSSWSQTYAYFAGLKRRFGDRHSIADLGQGAFLTDKGWVAVRKDWKVLFVRSSLKGRISGGTASGTAAEAVAVVILDCWKGD